MSTRKKEQTYFFMILPGLIGFLIMYITPTAMSFLYSLTNYSVYKADISFAGLANFKKVFTNIETVSALKNTVIFAILITVFQNAFSIIFAVLLNKKSKIVDAVKSLVFLPAVLSVMVVGYLFQYIMTTADGGLLNTIIEFFGGNPVNWLGNKKIALYSVLATQIWQWTGYTMVICIANLKSIDSTLYEAANIDGANTLQQFFHVTLPLLYPSVSFNVLMSLIGGMKTYDAILSMTKGGPGYATETIMTTLLREGIKNGKTAFGCAFAVVFFIVVFVLTRIVTYAFNKWEEAVQA